MTHLLDKKYVIVLPEGATAQLVPENTYKVWDVDKMDVVNLDGDWQILFTRDTQTEEGWKEVLGFGTVHTFVHLRKKHKNFYNHVEGVFSCKSATQSGHSLLQSKNIDPVSNWVIVEKI